MKIFLAVLVGIILCFMAQAPKEDCTVCRSSIVSGTTKSGDTFHIDACADERGVEYRMYIGDNLALVERVEQGVSTVLYKNEALLEASRKPPPTRS